MGENKAMKLTEEDLAKLTGGENINVSKYTEEELAQIFQLYFDMYGDLAALSYLNEWGVTSGDYYLMSHETFWNDSKYAGAPKAWKLAHLVYLRSHR